MNMRAVSLTTVGVTSYSFDISSTIGVHDYTIIDPENDERKKIPVETQR
jgi:hypothetical protein